MCRAGGRRCDTKWDDAHRERYNARRRIARNGQKAELARAVGDDAQAAYYEELVQSATAVEKELDESIRAHESRSAAEEPSVGDVSYRSGHSAPEDDGYSKPITQLTDGFFGDDVYEHPDWYGTSDDETMAQLKKVRDDPSATVTIYRAVPNGNREINQGDWVTLSRQYAEEHSCDLEGEGADGAIVSMEVPSSQVFTDGNDLAEYGYAGPSTPLGDDGSESVTSPPASGEYERERCGACGQFIGSSHSCPGAAFRDSAIRDEDGNLAVLYHGSATDFQEWDPEFTGTGNDSWGSGFYFTHSETLARGYGEHVKSVVLNVQNPIRVNGLDDASLDHVFFDAQQSAAILRRHPDIYRQPNDEEEMNPLGDYSPEFWDKDEWSKDEIDSMISNVAREHFDDVQWSHLENVFSRGQTDQFRRGVRDVTGHDGVVVDFKDDGQHTIAWFPEQIHTEFPAGAGDGSSAGRCPECGQFEGSGHVCPEGVPHLREERERYLQVVERWGLSAPTSLTDPPPQVHEAINEFAQDSSNTGGKYWVSATEPDGGDCMETSHAFATALQKRGIDAQPVLGVDGEGRQEDPMAQRYHVVTCVHHEGRHLHVDWTVKQYGASQMDLDADEALSDDPLAPENIPTPVVWDADQEPKHPIQGTADSYEWVDREAGQDRTTKGHHDDIADGDPSRESSNAPNGGNGANDPNGGGPAVTSHSHTEGNHERCSQCGRWVGSSHDCPQARELESLRQDSSAWRDSWTDEEADAFDAYGGIQHEEINAKLRAGTPLTAEEASVVRGLDSALARAPRADHERTLYRSFSLSEQRGDAPVDEWVETNLPQGETVSFDAYTSVTPDHAVSEEFSGVMSEYTDGGVVMEVHTSQSGYTGDSAESEVLLQRGGRFAVVSNEEFFEDNGKKFRRVIVQEVPSE